MRGGGGGGGGGGGLHLCVYISVCVCVFMFVYHSAAAHICVNLGGGAAVLHTCPGLALNSISCSPLWRIYDDFNSPEVRSISQIHNTKTVQIGLCPISWEILHFL